MKSLLSAVLLMAAGTCAAQAPAPDVAWPREVKAADGTLITVYQPQVERWAENNLSGRAAVSVKRPNEKEPRYGVIELTARTEIDKSSDLVDAEPGAHHQDQLSRRAARRRPRSISPRCAPR